MRWKWLLLVAGLLLIVNACNPKPEEDVVVEVEEEFIEIKNPGKMFEGENSFTDSPILEAVDKIMKYYDAPLTDDDFKKVRKTKMYGKESVLDVLNLVQNKGVPILPLYTDYNVIEEAVLKGKPVYAEFALISNNTWKVIFYGYSDEQFAYMDFETGEKKSVDRTRLATVDKFTALIPYKGEQFATSDLGQSAYYLEIVASDAYYEDDGDQILNALTAIENENLTEEIYFYNYLFMYYHTFYDFQPEIVEPILEKELASMKNPANMEISIALANYNEDEDKLKSELANLQLLPSHRTETLELIVEKGTEFGYTDLVAKAEEMLDSRTK
ncbi:hypothetical protein [Sporosarcina jiandibaonis]|uniref:hypothetical protein n=1 Tax=Sporosarcina jiandibaonis TaxID=2715535 RepID=UPI0015582188|nr:hypothetical protein [Sporosarcina jiandibaonis]